MNWRAVYDVFAKGGPVMWPLLACSVIALTLVIERLVFWWRHGRREDPGFVERVFDLTGRGDYARGIETARASPAFTARVLQAGLEHREHGLAEAMEVAAVDEVERMKHGLAVLDTIVSMAPMLGILGTVTGIIECFGLLGEGTAADPKAVSGGIAEALITTAAGLIVALGTLVPLNYFTGRVQRAARRLEQVCTQFEVVYRRSQARSATPPCT